MYVIKIKGLGLQYVRIDTHTHNGDARERENKENCMCLYWKGDYFSTLTTHLPSHSGGLCVCRFDQFFVSNQKPFNYKMYYIQGQRASPVLKCNEWETFIRSLYVAFYIYIFFSSLFICYLAIALQIDMHEQRSHTLASKRKPNKRKCKEINNNNNSNKNIMKWHGNFFVVREPVKRT